MPSWSMLEVVKYRPPPKCRTIAKMRRTFLGLLLLCSCGGFPTGEYVVQLDFDLPVPETQAWLNARGTCPDSLTERMACAEEIDPRGGKNVRCTSPRFSFEAGLYTHWRWRKPLDPGFRGAGLVDGLRVDEQGKKKSDGGTNCFYRIAFSKL